MANWIGTINDKWSEPLNWDTSAVPTSSDYVSFYSTPNSVVDVDVDIHVYYLNLDANLISFKMNDKTIRCNYLYNDTSAVNAIDCGTSTVILGSSAYAADTYTYANLGKVTLYKMITYNKCTILPFYYNSFFNTSGCTKILHSLVCHNIITMAPNWPDLISILDCPLIDLSDCTIMEAGQDTYWKVFKFGTTIIGREDGYFRDKTAFMINASADNQVIQLPSSNGYYSNAALILSPKDFYTQQLYSNVTFVAPASANYGLCGSKYLYEEYDREILTGGIYALSSTIDFSANNSVVRTDTLNLTGCNLKLNETADLYVDRVLNFSATTISYNPAHKIVFDPQYRKAFGSEDKTFSVTIIADSSITLPDIYVKRSSLLGNFKGSSLFYEGTPNNILGYNQTECALNGTMNLSGNMILNDFNGYVNGSVSANTFILSGCDYYQSQVLRNFNLKQTSGSLITNCYVNDFTINSSGADVSGINIYRDPYYGKPTKLVPIDEIAYVHNIWTNSGGDNLWTNAANWSLGHVQENHIATFDKNVTSALCIVNMDVGSIYGISAKPYSSNYYGNYWNYTGTLRFAENSKMRISRLADFSGFPYLEVVNQDAADLHFVNSMTDTTSNKVFFGFNPSIFAGMKAELPNISVYKKSQVIRNSGNDGRFCKYLNIYEKVSGYSSYLNLFSVGTGSNTSFGSCILYSQNALLFGNINLLNSTIQTFGTVEKPIIGEVMFTANNIGAVEIPNLNYPLGVGIGISATSTTDTTFTFAQGLIPNVSEVNLSSSAAAAIIDLRDHTKFGRISFGGTGNSLPYNRVLLPDSDFEVASTPSSLVKVVAGSNSRAILTNEHLPIENRIPEVYTPYSYDGIFFDVDIIVSGADKTVNITSKSYVKGFSAIGCMIGNPWNVYLNNGSSIFDPGIIAKNNILISGCKTRGSRPIDGNLHLSSGYLSYFEPSAFILSANKIELVETDFISHGFNFSAYSNVTPSAVNMNMRGGTALITSGDARFATSLGNNINWKFIDQKLYSVEPQKGTSWYNVVLLSGSDLDSANIYFDGELITDFDSLTPTSAICTVPSRSAGNYNFILG
jgi:hypothetical protein